MDGQDYLNQISATNRPIKTSKFSNIFSSKLFWGGIICVIALFIIMIIGSILSGNKVDPKLLSYALSVRLDNTSSVIKEYQDKIKSSTLRANSASLNGILSDTKSKLNNFLTETYNFKPKEVSKDILTQANLEKEGLANKLFEAKINGNLDRIFAHKMTNEISVIANQETKIIKASKNEQLKEILSTSYDSLLNLYDSFNNFSETK